MKKDVRDSDSDIEKRQQIKQLSTKMEKKKKKYKWKTTFVIGNKLYESFDYTQLRKAIRIVSLSA